MHTSFAGQWHPFRVALRRLQAEELVGLLDEKLSLMSHVLRKQRQLQVLTDTSSSAALHKLFRNMSRPEKKTAAERVASELVVCAERMRLVALRPHSTRASYLPLLFLPKHILGQIIYTLADADVHKLLQSSRAVFHFALVIAAVRKRREADHLRATAQLEWQLQLQQSARIALHDTFAGLRSLTRADLQELRNTKTASHEVHIVMYGACILLGCAQFKSAPTKAAARRSGSGTRRSVGSRADRPISPTRPLSRAGTPLPADVNMSFASSLTLERHSRSVLSVATDARGGLPHKAEMQFAWAAARARLHDSASFLSEIIRMAEHSEDIAVERLQMLRMLWSASNFGEARLHTVSKSVRAIGMWLCALLNHDVAVAPLHNALGHEQSICDLQALLARVCVPDDVWAAHSHGPRVRTLRTDFYGREEDDLIYFPPYVSNSSRRFVLVRHAGTESCSPLPRCIFGCRTKGCCRIAMAARYRSASQPQCAAPTSLCGACGQNILRARDCLGVGHSAVHCHGRRLHCC